MNTNVVFVVFVVAQIWWPTGSEKGRDRAGQAADLRSLPTRFT
jgi:hypothetical protein